MPVSYEYLGRFWESAGLNKTEINTLHPTLSRVPGWPGPGSLTTRLIVAPEQRAWAWTLRKDCHLPKAETETFPQSWADEADECCLRGASYVADSVKHTFHVSSHLNLRHCYRPHFTGGEVEVTDIR